MRYSDGHSTCCNAKIYFKTYWNERACIYAGDYFCKKCDKKTWSKEFQWNYKKVEPKHKWIPGFFKNMFVYFKVTNSRERIR